MSDKPQSYVDWQSFTIESKPMTREDFVKACEAMIEKAKNDCGKHVPVETISYTEYQRRLKGDR